MGGHKFSPDEAKHLDSPIRKLFLSPKKVIRDLQPQSQEVWADIGAGTGYFTIPIAGKVEKVYAVDINSAMLEKLQQKLQKGEVGNVETVLSSECKIPLEDGRLDGALLALVAHELDDPAAYFKEIARILRSDGRLIVVEYTKVQGFGAPFGPPRSERLGLVEVDSWANDAGLEKGNTWRWSRAIAGWEYRKP